MRRVGILLFVLALSGTAAAEVEVVDSNALQAAIAAAVAGDVIVLAPGEYNIASNLKCNANGTIDQPITLRADVLGTAVVNFDTAEGFMVSGAHWRFETLEIHGVCLNDSTCEHAFHITGSADGTIIRGNRVEGFNAHVKGNGSGTPLVFPNDVLIEHNEFFSDLPRQTANPVTPIDVVGGRRWTIRNNYIHDFEKAQGNGISFAAFLKGNSRDGVFSHNLIQCESLHQGGVRLGLSFGGGGTGTQYCEEGSCATEHQNGLMYNNIIANCPVDVGIYINKGANTKIYNNTLVNTAGIDVRFDTSTADLRNNLLDGRIRERNGGTVVTNTANVEVDLSPLFEDPGNLDFTLVDGSQIVNQGVILAQVVDDFCRAQRDDIHDIGALEFGGNLCDITSPFHPGSPIADAGPTWGDASPATGDAGTTTPGTGTKGGCGCQSGTTGSRSLLLLLIPFLFLGRRAESVGLIGIFSKNPDDRSSLFRRALRLGRAWDEYIDLYSSLEQGKRADMRSERLDEHLSTLESSVVIQTDTCMGASKKV